MLSFACRVRRTLIVGPDGDRSVGLVFPTVAADLLVTYGTVAVDIVAIRRSATILTHEGAAWTGP